MNRHICAAPPDHRRRRSGRRGVTTNSKAAPPRSRIGLKSRTSRVASRRTPSSSASATMEASTRPRLKLAYVRSISMARASSDSVGGA
jgi:hypothetical protein